MNLKDLQNCPNYRLLKKSFVESPWQNQEFYNRWLMQSYFYTSHSTRMLAFAAGWTPYEKTSYYRRSLQHIREEQGHEMLAIKDLEQFKTEQDKTELGCTKALWESQFYKMQRNPEVLLGYILALEMLAVDTFANLYSTLQKTWPEYKHEFVRVHAEDDPEHVEEALQQIEKCGVELQRPILDNFIQTCDMYRLMLQETQSYSMSELGHSKTYSTFNVDAQPMTVSLES